MWQSRPLSPILSVRKISREKHEAIAPRVKNPFWEENTKFEDINTDLAKFHVNLTIRSIYCRITMMLLELASHVNCQHIQKMIYKEEIKLTVIHSKFPALLRIQGTSGCNLICIALVMQSHRHNQVLFLEKGGTRYITKIITRTTSLHAQVKCTVKRHKQLHGMQIYSAQLLRISINHPSFIMRILNVRAQSRPENTQNMSAISAFTSSHISNELAKQQLPLAGS